MKKIIIFLTFLSLAASQGMLAKGKQKLEELENTIRENAAKLNIKTPASFNGERQDLKKIGQLKRKTKEETKKNENMMKRTLTKRKDNKQTKEKEEET